VCFTTALVVADHKTLRIRIKRIGLQAFLGRGRISPVGSDPLRALNRPESTPSTTGTIREHRRGENSLNHPNQY
jgi:hypothetical protein